MLIDDDVELLRQMSIAFTTAGYEVRAAPDGQVGIDRFKAEPTELVVCDIIMPTREGVETIFALRRGWPGLKIIAISGGYRLGPEPFLDLARHVGANDALSKPFRPTALVAAADRLLAEPAPGDLH